MRRLTFGIVCPIAATLLLASPAYAAGSDGGAGLTGLFGRIGFLVLAGGLGVSAYRVSLARRKARDSGTSLRAATFRALRGDDDDPPATRP